MGSRDNAKQPESRRVAAIVDCYTVEPSGLGVPPYLSGYARTAFAVLRRAYPDADIRYLTIDDVRWCRNGGRPFTAPPLSDQLTCSATAGRHEALKVIADSVVVVVIAGDAVPSVQLQARKGSPRRSARYSHSSGPRPLRATWANSCRSSRGRPRAMALPAGTSQ